MISVARRCTQLQVAVCWHNQQPQKKCSENKNNHYPQLNTYGRQTWRRSDQSRRSRRCTKSLQRYSTSQDSATEMKMLTFKLVNFWQYLVNKKSFGRFFTTTTGYLAWQTCLCQFMIHEGCTFRSQIPEFQKNSIPDACTDTLTRTTYQWGSQSSVCLSCWTAVCTSVWRHVAQPSRLVQKPLGSWQRGNWKGKTDQLQAWKLTSCLCFFNTAGRQPWEMRHVLCKKGRCLGLPDAYCMLFSVCLSYIIDPRSFSDEALLPDESPGGEG